MVFTASCGHGIATLFRVKTFVLRIRITFSQIIITTPPQARPGTGRPPKEHQPSAGSHRSAPGRWASLPIHRHSALSLSSTALARGLSGGLGRDQMQPERTQHSRKALRERPQAAIPGGSASGAPPLGGAPLPAAANAEALGVGRRRTGSSPLIEDRWTASTFTML